MTMKNFSIKNNAKVLALTAAFSMGMFSCQESLLDPLPKTLIATENIFDTSDRVALLVNGMYTGIKSGNFLGGRAQIYGDVRADDFLNRTSNGVTAYLVWQQTINEASQNDVINMWTLAYQGINDINNVIEGLQDPATVAKMVPPAFPATFLDAGGLRDQYVAEGKFLRAISYHTLLQFYARPYTRNNGNDPGLPLRLLAENGPEHNLLARATVAEVYAQILKDLNEAEAALPATITNTLTRTTRAHKNSAIAFKTRVYLTMGDWANVIAEANKIVPIAGPFVATSGVAHALQPNVANVFAVPQETAEMIFAFPFTAQNTPGGQNQLGFYYRSSSTSATANPVGFQTPGGGEFGLNTAAGGILADNVSWPATDARRTSFVYAVAAERFLGKYPSGTPYLDKAPVIRWPEVLLNLSEALARQSGTVDTRSLELLNAVRTRSTGVTGILAPADNAALISNILTERRIEFLGEGLRNQDVMRTLGTFPAKGSVPAVGLNSPQYVWPIPITERAVNTDAVANETIPN